MIRPYEDSDLDRVMTIWHDASKVGHPFMSAQLLAEQRIEIREKFVPIAKQWVYLLGGKVVGFIAMIDHFVGGLFIDPEYHRRGIATHLLNYVKPFHTHLALEVFKENHGARKFYKDYGFHVTEERTSDPLGFPALLLEIVFSTEK